MRVVGQSRAGTAGRVGLVLLAASSPSVLLALLATDQPVASALVVVAATVPVGLAVAWVVARQVETSRARLERKQEVLIQEAAALSTRLAITADVLDSSTRRPWEPSLRARVDDGRHPVALLPGADYHLPELVAIARALQLRGVPTQFACGRPHWARVVHGLAWYPDLEVQELASVEQVNSYRAVVTMKDWAGYGPLVRAAREAGIPTIAKVEGVQDFHADDAPEDVGPYRHAATVLCQGENDRRELSRDRGSLHVVGNSRLEGLWLTPVVQRQRPLAVINLNFTAGVLAAQRMGWLRSAVAACERADVPYVISLHPAERVRNPHPQALSIGVSRLLEQATVLISRFSTAPFEAVARGVPFIYHNPHDERVPIFRQPDGAFDATVDSDELAEAVSCAQDRFGEPTRKRARDFFLRQIDVDPTRPAGERAADIIESLLPE